MKVLIVGKNSYIGRHLDEWLKDRFGFDTEAISVRDDSWMDMDLSYDAVVYTAGIVHRKESEVGSDTYFRVNSDIPYLMAQKARTAGCRHFIYFSSMSVYGILKGVIDDSTKLTPDSAYGKSKLQAEERLKELQNETFTVTFIRPPMVYGKNCKGNYTRLSGLVRKVKMFPIVKNRRGVIYIDNLSEAVGLAIKHRISGVLLPQDRFTPSTWDIVREIGRARGFRVIGIPLVATLFSKIGISTFEKLFGSLYYSEEVTGMGHDYNVVDFKDAVKASES